MGLVPEMLIDLNYFLVVSPRKIYRITFLVILSVLYYFLQFTFSEQLQKFRHSKNTSTQPWYEEKNRTHCTVNTFRADPADMLTNIQDWPKNNGSTQ